MKNLVIKGVECRLNENGVVELNLEHVARGLGFTTIAGSGNEVVRWNTVHGYLSEFGVATSCNDTSYRDNCPNYVAENIFYKLCFKAKNEIAKSFQDLVTDEILPSIRKNGMYASAETVEKMLSDPENMIKVLTALKDERSQRIKAEAKVQKLQPKAEFADRAIDMGNLVDIGQAAKILKLPFGRNTFFSKLRENGIFFKNRNEPKQEYIDRGYFELREKPIERKNHPNLIITVVLVTQKGLYWLSKEFEAASSFKIPSLNIK